MKYSLEKISRIDYLKIADSHGIKLHMVKRGDSFCEANGEDAYMNDSYCAGKDEIILGIYDDEDLEIASFFHELGHCITKKKWEEGILKFHMELDAWMVGLTEAYKYGYHIKSSTFEYMVKCIDSYIGYEERET